MGLKDLGFLKMRVDAHLRVITMQKCIFMTAPRMKDCFEFMKHKNMQFELVLLKGFHLASLHLSDASEEMFASESRKDKGPIVTLGPHDVQFVDLSLILLKYKRTEKNTQIVIFRLVSVAKAFNILVKCPFN